MSSTNIFYTPDKLKRFLKNKIENKKIVMCHGVFDVLHHGHLLHFQEAKKYGDILIVSITSDKYVNKGPDRPVFQLKTRLKSVSMIKNVDYVVASKNLTAVENLKIIRPNVYFKGPDYKNKKDINRQLNKEINIAKDLNIRVKFSKGKTDSSTRILNKVKNKFNREQLLFLNKIKKKYGLDKITKLISDIKRQNLSIIGEIIYDKYNFIDPVGVSGKDPFLVLKKKFNENYVGGSFSIANNISYFLKKINLISFYNSKNNFNLLKKIKNSNLKMKLIKSKKLKDIEKLRYVDFVTKNKVIGIYDYFDGVEEAQIKKKFLTKIKNHLSKNFIVVDYGHGFLSNEIINEINKKKYLYTLNAQVNSTNRGYHGLFKYRYPLATIINEGELRYELKDKYSNIEYLMKKLKKNLISKNIIVTKGKQGMIMLNEKNEFLYCPSFHDEVVDKVGAGDTLLGFYSMAKFSGLQDDLCIFLGSLAAGISVGNLSNKRTINNLVIEKKITELLK